MRKILFGLACGLSVACKLEADDAGAKGPRRSQAEGALCCLSHALAVVLGLTVAGCLAQAQPLPGSVCHQRLPLFCPRRTPPVPLLHGTRKCPLPRPSSVMNPHVQEVGPSGPAAPHTGSGAEC